MSTTEVKTAKVIMATSRASNSVTNMRVEEMLEIGPYINYHETLLGGTDQISARDVEYGKALIVTSKLRYETVHVRLPKLHEEDVMIETRAVGLNPIDWKSVDYNFCLPEFPWVTGREMAGVVHTIGSKVNSLKVGDRVWTSTYYRKREAGCFQQYVTVPQHTVLKMPSNLDFESAACLGVPGLTATMTLWHWLNIPCPVSLGPEGKFISRNAQNICSTSHNFVLIWGGSTVTGQFAIQMAKASGLNVITVVSSKTATLVSKLGADHVVVRDGKSDQDIVAEVRRLESDSLTYAIDVVGPHTAALALKALSSSQPSIIAPLSFLPTSIQNPENVTVKTIEMKHFVLKSENRVYAEILNNLIQSENIQLPQLEYLPGGLAGIPAGLERLKKGDMQGKKLVLKV